MSASTRSLSDLEQDDADRWSDSALDAPSEPDWEQIVEDRYADNFDEDAAQDRVDNAIYGE